MMGKNARHNQLPQKKIMRREFDVHRGRGHGDVHRGRGHGDVHRGMMLYTVAEA